MAALSVYGLTEHSQRPTHLRSLTGISTCWRPTLTGNEQVLARADGRSLAIADAEGLGCYLETETEENVAYYRRHGFEVRTEWDLMTDDENDRSQGPHQWGMWRQPR